jgi:hypothetical protein
MKGGWQVKLIEASLNNFDQIQRCMLKKSYHYLGQCDNEMAKTSPGCDAS